MESKAFERESKEMVEKHRCWLCGEKKPNKENHHAIPKSLKPWKNKTVPVCHECHNKINTFYSSQYGKKSKKQVNNE